MINDSLLVIFSLFCLLIPLPGFFTNPTIMDTVQLVSSPVLYLQEEKDVDVLTKLYMYEANVQSQAVFSEQATVRKPIQREHSMFEDLGLISFLCGRAVYETRK